MTTEQLAKKVLALSASGIVHTMVAGLRDPKVVIDMGTYGVRRGGDCFGCAATCALIELGASTHAIGQEGWKDRLGAIVVMDTADTDAGALPDDVTCLASFELVVDWMRWAGQRRPAHRMLYKLDHVNGPSAEHFAEIVTTLDKRMPEDVPSLRAGYTQEELDAWQAFGESLAEEGL